MALALYCGAALSAGLASAVRGGDTLNPDVLSLQTQSGDVVGLFGGIVTAHHLNGTRQTALLAVLPSGYVVPLLGDGTVSTFPVSYFREQDCRGREFLPATSPEPALLPFHGLVFRSLATGQPAHITRHQAALAGEVRSRLDLRADGTIECSAASGRPLLYPAATDTARSTGFHAPGDGETVTIRGADQQLVQDNPAGTSTGAPEPGVGADPDFATASQAECSPTCLTASIGDQACDIECYNESCFYDGGDCDAVPTHELQEALAGMCSPGCSSAEPGDGFCDAHCNTAACGYDGGDCQ